MTETEAKAKGITPEQLARLRDGGWQDGVINSPGWERYFGEEDGEGGYVRHWVFLGVWNYPGESDDRWCANITGPQDYDVDAWTDSLDKALDVYQPPPGLEMKPAERDCTDQAAKFAYCVERIKRLRPM